MSAAVDLAAKQEDAVCALMSKRFVSVAEAALIADRHPETIRDAARAGILHGSQPLGDNGRQLARARWRFRPACLDAYMSGEKCEHQRAAGVAQLDEYRARASGARR